MKPTAVAVVLPTPIPYSLPVLARIAASPEIELTVFYCRRSLPGRRAPQEIPFRHVFVPNIGAVVVRRDVHEVDLNPTIPFALERGSFAFVVVSGFVQPTMLAAIGWAKLRRRPYGILSESHGLRERGPVKAAVRDALVGRVVRGAAALFPTSGLAGAELRRLGGRADAVFPLPHVADPAHFSATGRRDLRERIGVPDDELLVAFVGRLVESKDVATALAATARARRPVHLVVVGDGPLDRALRQSAPPDVTFLGALPPDEVATVLRSVDALVIPSRDEPFGTVAIEAVTCGCPVIGTDVIPAAHELSSYGAALLFRVGDVEALAALYDSLDAARLDGLRAGARAAAPAFTADAVAETFVTAIRASHP